MAKAVCCDRCGKFEKQTAVSGVQEPRWVMLDGVQPNSIDPLRDRDGTLLCPSCAAKFKKFMQAGN